MSEAYAKVGQNVRLYFLVRNATTGIADSTFLANAFTLQIGKELVGNQSTTGCTFGVLDSTNNPGVAYIDCSGSSSFVAATGNYALKVTRISDGSKIWTQTIRVTSDGTGAGTWGSSSFTPVAGNGRILSAGVPIAGVTVRILTSTGTIYSQDTSNVLGLWNTVYFNTDGTYTISAQRSGYTIATGTITVVSGVVTGPAVDLTVTPASSGTTLTASDLWAYARRMLTDNTGTKADTEVREAVDDALAYLAMAKQWPYLLALGTVDLQAAYTTGTVTIANGSTTATFAGATLPSWAASGSLYVNGSWASVNTRDSSSQLTLTAAWGEAAVTAGSYTLVQYAYALPTNLQRIDKIIFQRDWPYDQEVSAAKLEYLRTVWQQSGSFPNTWAVSGANFLVWPFPSAAHRVNVLYYKRPALLVNSSDVVEWDPAQLMLLRRSIDAQCALRGNCVAGTVAETRATLDEAIDTAFSWDRTGTDRGLGDGPMSWYADDFLRGSIS